MSIGGLARRFVQDQLLSESEAITATDQAKVEKLPLISYLVSKGLADAKKIAISTSDEFGTPIFDLDAFDPESIDKEIVSADLVVKHHAIPLFKRGNRLFIGISDPTNLVGLDEIKFHTGLSTEGILVEEDKLVKFIEAYDDDGDDGIDDLDEDVGDLDVVED